MIFGQLVKYLENNNKDLPSAIYKNEVRLLLKKLQKKISKYLNDIRIGTAF